MANTKKCYAQPETVKHGSANLVQGSCKLYYTTLYKYYTYCSGYLYYTTLYYYH